MAERYIGLMSGTSMDGIDAVLVEINGRQINLLASHSHQIEQPLKERLQLLSLDSKEASLDLLGEADSELGLVFADAALQLLSKSGYKASQITAIGSHGQTIRHRPDLKHSFSMQIGDANRISYHTGITTIADFRRKDMAAGGEGAPLTPAFHQLAFHSDTENRATLNIGGIANLTALPADSTRQCFGFDTGPGNMLMDAWIQKHKNLSFDKEGKWASSSVADEAFVTQLMADPYLKLAPPKSTGKEHYNLLWLDQQLKNFPHLTYDQVQASLCELTSRSISDAVKHFIPETETLVVCGGGAHNSHLIKQLRNRLSNIDIQTSDIYGIDPDWVEAIAFAWLASQTINGKTSNIAKVTGACQTVVLGAIYPP